MRKFEVVSEGTSYRVRLYMVDMMAVQPVQRELASFNVYSLTVLHVTLERFMLFGTW